ncbi:putative nucleic acid-binding protein [Helianthus debilis subsp. tardiflorus]
MENNKITLFRSLNAHSTNYTIKAKIISMWNKKMNGSDSQIYRVDMLLMDEEGSFIQCSCLHKLFKRFLKFLVVDDCLCPLCFRSLFHPVSESSMNVVPLLDLISLQPPLVDATKTKK